MRYKKFVLFSIFTSMLFSMTGYTKQVDESFDIPYLADAKVFAEFTDELPAVLNYFTLHNEQEIIEFYQQNLVSQ